MCMVRIDENRRRGLTPWLAVMLVDFYMLPLLMADIDSTLLVFTVVMPLVCVAVSAWHGWRVGVEPLLPWLAAVLWVLSVLVYNAAAWVYAPVYAVLALVGNLLGRWPGR